MNIFRINIWLLIAVLFAAIPAAQYAQGKAYLMSGQKMSGRNINFVPFQGGAANVSAPDIGAAAKFLATATTDYTPTAGGTMTVNGAALGSFDYRIVTGNQTVSSFVNADWFTSTADSRSAWVIVKGNLTINSGQTFIPSNRKLFTIVFVTGNLTVNGGISMSARGANHSATGSNITAAAIKIASGTYSSVTDPSVPAACAAGGASVLNNSTGNPGSAGSGGCTGGGGSGADRNGGGSGAGAAGTSFSGGSGGGGGNALSGVAGSGAANGGAGGGGTTGGGGQGGSGGAGNPGGPAAGTSAQNGNDGTGGVLIIIALGTYSGSGTVTANGANGSAYLGANGAAGAASGGGSITIMYGVDSGPTPTAAGGVGITPSGGAWGSGSGGAGTARKLGPYARLLMRHDVPIAANNNPLSYVAA